MLWKCIILLFILAFIKLGQSNEVNKEAREAASVKRLLLHSDEDLVTEFLNFKETVDARLKGSIFTRWGRKTCPENTELVYEGFLAGKHYTESGSGVDSLCLPEEPVWGSYHDGDEARTVYRAYIYGAEIDTNDDARVFPYNVNEQDMPCAVCQTNNSINLMIPARNTCYSGWKKEYSGYLMAGSHSNNGHNHICMDGEPEFLQHGGNNDNEHILYLVEGRCGSLPCPPYVQGRELTCVVCSK